VITLVTITSQRFTGEQRNMLGGKMDKIEDAVKVYVLSKQFMSENLDAIVNIERDYSETWLPDNFMMDVPMKWELSRYASIGEKPVGFLIASLREDSIALHRFMVDPDYRDRHIGAIIYSDFEQACMKIQGVKKITLNVLADNTGAIEFYKRLGYAICSKRSDTARRYGMEKILRE